MYTKIVTTVTFYRCEKKFLLINIMNGIMICFDDNAADLLYDFDCSNVKSEKKKYELVKIFLKK